MLDYFITAQVNGVNKGTVYQSEANKKYAGGSQIYAGSLHASYVNGDNTTQLKDTDDKIVIGYTDNCLPFMIVVDGFFGGETQHV